jgi:RNA polymerase sigma-70 factor (ECF subfamily)
MARSTEIADEPMLIARTRDGDALAFETIVRHYHPELFAFAMRWIRDRDDTDDVLQDVFLSVWRHRETLTVDAPLRAYLYRAVRNAVHNVYRARTVAQAVYDDAGDPHSTSDVYDPQHALEQDELRVAVERTVAGLPNRCKEVWILVRERGLSYTEAGQVLGIAPGTVHVQLSRAFSAIRKAIGPLLGAIVVAR